MKKNNLNEVPTITYKKNGQEVTKTITRLNVKNIQKKLFTGRYFVDFHFRPDVKLVHFKNIKFDDVINFKMSNDKQILILENCKFNHATFCYGNIQLINPKPSNEFSSLNIKSNYVENLSIELANDINDLTNIETNYNKNIFINGNNTKINKIEINELNEANLINISNADLSITGHYYSYCDEIINQLINIKNSNLILSELSDDVLKKLSIKLINSTLAPSSTLSISNANILYQDNLTEETNKIEQNAKVLKKVRTPK